MFSRTVPLSMGSENWGFYLIANVLSHVRSVAGATGLANVLSHVRSVAGATWLVCLAPWLNDFLSQAK